MQRALTSLEVADLLNRHFELNGKVLQHRRIVDSGQWDQIRMEESVFFGLPIPAKGLIVQDDMYGLVVVFPDASGALHYSGDVPATFGQGDVSKPPFQSESGNTLQQLLIDLQRGIGTIVAGVVIVAVVYLVVLHNV